MNVRTILKCSAAAAMFIALGAPGTVIAATPASRALDLNNAAALKLGALERELQQIELGPVFTAAALTSPERIAQGMVTISRLRALTAHRREVARRHAADLEALKRATPGALSGLDHYLVQGDRVHHDLHAARTEVADAADAVLGWAQAQGDAIRLENGRIKMKTPEHQQQFNELFARLEVAMTQHEKAVDAFELHRKAYLGRLRNQPVPKQY